MSEMSDDELTTAEAKPLSPLQILFVKVAIITAAIIAVLYCASYFFESLIASKAEQLIHTEHARKQVVLLCHSPLGNVFSENLCPTVRKEGALQKRTNEHVSSDQFDCGHRAHDGNKHPTRYPTCTFGYSRSRNRNDRA
jgi:hypothetical protein